MQHRTRFSHLTSRASAIAVGMALSGSIVATTTRASAQAVPFPSTNVPAGNGRFVTTVLTTRELEAQYTRWKQLFIATCPNNQLRVQYPESASPDQVNDTRSEGIGYGMLIAAYMGDLPTFQGLRNFYFGHTAGTGLMDWKWNDCTNRGNNGQGSAADADVDAAMSLIVAAKQWPTMTFGNDANTLLNAIRTSLFSTSCTGILLAGTTFANCGCINASYIPVGYYPAFATTQTGQAATWNTARTNSYTYYNAVNDNTTGLVPAWSSFNSPQTGGGCNPEVGGGGQPNQFQADAARTPWRVSVDNAWTGNASAQTFLTSVANFAKTQPIVNIVDLYNLNGAPQHGVTNGAVNADGFRSTFVMGGFATAMTASSQADLDAFTGAWQSLYLHGDTLPTAHAFNSSLAILYGLLVTGTMWDPNGAAPTPVTEPTLQPQGTNLVVNGDFDEGVQGWLTEDVGTPPSQGYAMHLGGEVHLRIQANDPTQPYNLQFSQIVGLQANQNYLLSLKARSADPRNIRLVVALNAAPYTTYGQLVNRYSATDPLALTPDMVTYETVFHTTVADPQAKLAVQFGDSMTEVVIDDVTLTPTDRPITVPGELAGQAPPTTPGTTDGTTPPAAGGGGTTPPAAGGGGTSQPGGTTGQTIPSQGDLGSSPGGSTAPSSSGLTAVPVSGGAPPVPTGRPTGNGTCKADADCGTPFKCSTAISLCYDTTNGYVWDAAQNNGQGGWSLPPMTADCYPYVFWPLKNGCYDPVSGYAYNPTTMAWEAVGQNYVPNQFGSGPSSKSGCTVSRVESNGPAPLWALFGTLGTALSLAYRRRR